MKKHTGVLWIVLAFALMFPGCSQSAVPKLTATATSPAAANSGATASPEHISTPTPVLPATAAPTTQAPPPTPAPTPTFTPLPIPTVNLIPDLPDPGLWKPTLQLRLDEYPRVDGSTATMPLGIYMRSKITGASLSDSTAATKFSMTGQSYLALANDSADLLVVYEAPDEIKDELITMGARLDMAPIGLDALVFLTNKGNPVSGLTHEQITQIYGGKIKKWSEVGGEAKNIVPYQRISNSGSQALMMKLVMKNRKIMDAPAGLKPNLMDELVDAIAAYENSNNALGYSVYYYVRNMYKVPGIKLLDVNGVTPNPKTIASGEYPYINAFYAVIRANEPKGSPARKLYEWLAGAEGKRAVADAGYVASN